MSLERVVLLPHPPIALPEIAKNRFEEVKSTAESMLKVCSEIVESGAETIVVITPHSSLHHSSFAIFNEETLTVDFSMFAAPEIKFGFKNNLKFIKKLHDHRDSEDKHDIVFIKEATKLDHGSGVPLYYLYKAGYKGSIVVINYSFASCEKHIDFGKSIAKIANELDEKVVFVASGDLSHRITPSAPAGFHPDGEKFDKFIIENIKEGNYDSIINVNSVLRQNAGECAFNSLMVGFGVCTDKPKDNKIYSYEAPFGVGYLVASI